MLRLGLSMPSPTDSGTVGRVHRALGSLGLRVVFLQVTEVIDVAAVFNESCLEPGMLETWDFSDRAGFSPVEEYEYLAAEL